MPAVIDLTGKKFGKLTVRCPSKKRDKFGGRQWVCDCSCGTKGIVVPRVLLTSGRKKSCGCLSHPTSSDAAKRMAAQATRCANRGLLTPAAAICFMKKSGWRKFSYTTLDRLVRRGSLVPDREDDGRGREIPYYRRADLKKVLRDRAGRLRARQRAKASSRSQKRPVPKLVLAKDECTSEQAAKIRGCRRETINSLVRQGKLKAKKRRIPGRKREWNILSKREVEANARHHAETHGQGPNKRAEIARDVLRDILANGEAQLRSEVLKECKRRGIRYDLAIKMAKKLKVVTSYPERGNNGRNGSGPGYWRLPKSRAADSPASVNSIRNGILEVTTLRANTVEAARMVYTEGNGKAHPSDLPSTNSKVTSSTPTSGPKNGSQGRRGGRETATLYMFCSEEWNRRSVNGELPKRSIQFEALKKRLGDGWRDQVPDLDTMRLYARRFDSKPEKYLKRLED